MSIATARPTQSRRANAALWTIQGLLAALFLFAGGMKLVMPVAVLAQQSHLPGGFMKFIGVCEVLGAVGLIVPALTKIRGELTPLAAAGLVIIMIGATTVTLLQGVGAGAVVPAVVGVLAATVARGRTRRAAPREILQRPSYAKAA
ncbi:MAG TPA: DoxX family protein [Gemmatimonadaceae bacterium]|nr:DoxX family protein [Gemmatimonadaceae bacterium]